jgi:HAD superfamily hydrolase (TIGR01509 family)
MHELKAIIFDMDGTLADTEDIHRQAFNQAFSEFNFEWQWSIEEYKRLLEISGGKERIRNYFHRQNFVSAEHKDLSALAITVHKRKSDIYRVLLVADHIQLRVGVRRLIEEARSKNLTLAIATSSSLKNVETLLTNTLGKSALNYFSAIISSDDVDEKKPSPAVYLKTLSELGLAAENCIAIEDTCNGNKSAIDARLKTVITTHVYTTDDDFSGASLVVEQLGEIDQAFTVQAGDCFSKTFVDVELLQSICGLSPPADIKSNWSPEQIASATS